MIKVIIGKGEAIMSFGLVEAATIKSKKALREALADRGADDIRVFDTSAFDSVGTVTLAELYALRGSVAVIVGPDVWQRRSWYANIDRKSDGTYIIK